MDNESAQQNALLSCLLLSAGVCLALVFCRRCLFLPLSATYSTSRYCLLGCEKRSAEYPFWGVQRAMPFGR